MRHKQRPTRSSRHKSVTFIIDGHTSFGESKKSQTTTNSSIIINTSGRSQPILSPSTALTHKQHQARTTSSINYHHHHHHHNNNNNNLNLNHVSPQHNHLPDPESATSFPSTSSNRHPSTNRYTTNTNSTTNSTNTNSNLQRAIVATIDDSHNNEPLLRKQFEHNYRHMSDVMRLAFLENNDISIEDCSNIDFNSLSTASILQRNIQQQLQQERRDRLQLKQSQELQQQQFQLQQYQRDNQHYQQQFQDYQQQDTDFDESDNNDYYNISDDNRIFATAGNISPKRGFINCSTPKNNHNYHQQQYQLQQPGGSGIINNNELHYNNINNVSNGGASSRKRKQEISLVDTSNDLLAEAMQSHGEGFLCDEPGCGKSFPSLRKLRHHKVVHSDEFPFVCEFNGCAKKFKRKFGIDLHSTTHFDLDPDMYSKTSNNSSLPFFGRRMQYSMCKPCGQKFKTVHDYQYHMLKHGKEPFKCPVKGCGQTFGIWKSFQKHRASHYFNYYCKMDPRCDHHTSNLQLLKLHIYCCHFKRKLPENATLASKDPPEEDASQNEQLDIIETKEQLDVSSNLLDEKQITTKSSVISSDINISHEPVLDTQEADVDQTSSYNEPLDESPPKSPEPTTRRDSRLRRNPPRSSTYHHQDYVSPKRTKIKCNLCDLKFSSRSQLTKHLSTHLESPASKHQSPKNISQQQQQQQQQQQLVQKASGSGGLVTDDLDISAESLSASGGSKRRLKEVPRAKFTNDVPVEVIQNHGEGFLCDEPGCGKSFPSLRKLRHHKVVHSDEFPFVCEFNGCAKKFKRKFGIDLHSTTHFDLDPDMYSKTSNNSSLPFFGRRMQYSMCKPCGQKFKTVHDYQYHMLKHGKEPFKCPVKGCGQTFGIWKSFQKHRASHYFNYYCKMDPRCDHHTSNLQLLKLHIYCCHFKRKLPENATLASKDPPEEDASQDEQLDVVETEDRSDITMKIEDSERQEDIEVDEKEEEDDVREDGEEEQDEEEDEQQEEEDEEENGDGSGEDDEEEENEDEDEDEDGLSVTDSRKSSRLSSLRRDCRLRKNPPRSSAYGHQDYTSPKRNKFKCHLCEHKFSVRFQLTKHLSTHLELTPEMFSATADEQVVQLSGRRRREFYCDKCSVKFEHMHDLDNHMRKHGQRPYVCHFCPMPSTFRLAKQYLSHLYEHRFNYKCRMAPDCDFTINRKDALKLHIFRMHLNQQLPSYIENFANLLDCSDWSEP